jgi:UDP-N-acetylmuramoyl-tripeptide--D-alanyl-D-alanine ligase
VRCVRDVTAVTGGRLRLATLPPLGGELEPFGRIVTDIEKVTDGDVYWPLPAGGAAATAFVEGAFLRGAQGVVVGRRGVEPWAGRFVLEVDDAEKCLLELAAWSRRQWAGTVVAAVQTAGPPRLGTWIAGLLRTRFPQTRRLTVSNGGQLATALCNWPTQTEFAVVEIHGAAPDKIAQATRLGCPQIGVISAGGETIQGDYAKWEPVKEGLAALTAAIPPDGWLVTDGDEPQLDELACLRRCRLMRVGRDSTCDVAATDVRAAGGQTTFRVRGTQYTCVGDQQQDLAAVLAAVAVARITGLSAAEIAAGLAGIDVAEQASGQAA